MKHGRNDVGRFPCQSAHRKSISWEYGTHCLKVRNSIHHWFMKEISKYICGPSYERGVRCSPNFTYFFRQTGEKELQTMMQSVEVIPHLFLILTKWLKWVSHPINSLTFWIIRKLHVNHVLSIRWLTALYTFLNLCDIDILWSSHLSIKCLKKTGN